MMNAKSKAAFDEAKAELARGLREAENGEKPPEYRSYLLLRGINRALIALFEAAE